MSGPVQPPLTVQTIDGTTTGRPITTIKVTNGDLTVSGDVATIDTSGGGGGGMTSFDLAADSGATQSIGNGDTLSVLGGRGIASAASATDTVTLDMDIVLVGGATPNYYDLLTINDRGQVTAVDSGTAPQEALTLTTTGTSGAATLSAGTLNIPQYSGGGSGVGGSGTIGTIPVFVTDTTTIGDSRMTQPNTYETLIAAAGGMALSLQATDANEPNLRFLNSSSQGIYFQQNADGASLYLKPIGSGSKLWQVTTGGAVTINDAYTLPTVVTGANDYALVAQTDGTTAWAEVTASVPDPLRLSYGSAGAPTYSFSSDTDTGIYGAAGNIYFSTNGVGYFKMGNDGAAAQLTLGGGSGAGQLTTNGAQDLILNTNLGTNSGVITITDGANGGITVNPDGTGTVGLGNFILDVDQPVGASQDAYVLPYTNSTGEISLKEAGGGGGGGIGIVYPPVTNSQSTSAIHWGHISAPFGTSNQTTQTFSTDSPCWIPIIARRTATFTDIAIQVTSGAGSTSNVDLGIYSDDSGEPGTLLGQATVDVDTSGEKKATLAAEAGQSLSSVAGTQYWLAMVRQAGVGSFTMQAANKGDVGQWAWTPYSTSYGIIVQSGSDNTLPASATFSSGFAWNTLAIGVDYE